jgi:molybdopterin synthase catalytic subunit
LRLEVRLFALARQLAGMPVVLVDVPDPATAGRVRDALRLAYPALADLLSRMRIAVDSEYVEDDRQIAPGSEVALIPPVSGGIDG